jgi:hypothetical protein
VLLSNVGWGQTSDGFIACPLNNYRKPDVAYRISMKPIKILSAQIDSNLDQNPKPLGPIIFEKKSHLEIKPISTEGNHEFKLN